MLSLCNIPIELTTKSDGVYFFKETSNAVMRHTVIETTEEDFYHYIDSDIPNQEYNQLHGHNIKQLNNHGHLYWSSPWPIYSIIEV